MYTHIMCVYNILYKVIYFILICFYINLLQTILFKSSFFNNIICKLKGPVYLISKNKYLFVAHCAVMLLNNRKRFFYLDISYYDLDFSLMVAARSRKLIKVTSY